MKLKIKAFLRKFGTFLMIFCAAGFADDHRYGGAVFFGLVGLGMYIKDSIMQAAAMIADKERPES